MTTIAATIIALQVVWALDVGRSGVLRATLQQAFQTAGLRVPRDPTAKAVLTRLSQAIAIDRPWLGQKRLGGGIALVSHRVDPTNGAKLAPVHFATLSVDKSRALDVAPLVDLADLTQAERDLLAGLQFAYEQARDYATAVDLRVIIQRAIRGSELLSGMAGSPVVGSGVQAYWVPARFAQQLQALGDIVRALTPKSRFEVYSLTDAGGNLGAISSAVSSSALQDLEDTLNELRQLSGTKAGEASISRRVERIRILGERVDLWRDVLADKAEELQARIALARANVVGELGLEDGGPKEQTPITERQLGVLELAADFVGESFSQRDLITRAIGGGLKQGQAAEAVRELVARGHLRVVGRGYLALVVGA